MRNVNTGILDVDNFKTTENGTVLFASFSLGRPDFCIKHIFNRIKLVLLHTAHLNGRVGENNRAYETTFRNCKTNLTCNLILIENV